MILTFSNFSLVQGQIQEKQQENQKKEGEDQRKEEQKPIEEKKIRYDYGIFLGADLFSPLSTIKSDKDKRHYEFLSYMRFYKKHHMAFEVGKYKVLYSKLGWKAHIEGFYYKMGLNYDVFSLESNPDEMFYIGVRYAFSLYDQKIKEHPIRSFSKCKNAGELPKISLKAHWLEPLIGGRFSLFNSGFYIDISLHFKFLMHAIKQINIEPLVIPGFGENLDEKNISLKWALTYKIPIIKGI